jgi:HlyD family secretion protein
MDLERLKIEDHQRERDGGGVFKFLFVAVIFLAIGFTAGWFMPKKSTLIKVNTIVAKSSSGKQRVNSFTAGGWVEVASPEHPLIISSRVAERIEEILVKEGEIVTSGQVLVKLYNRDKKIELDLAKANLKKAESKYKMMKKGYREEELHMAEEVLADYKERFRIAKAHYDRDVKLGKDVVSAKAIDISLALFTRARASYNLAKFKMEKMKAGFREEEIAMANAELSKAGFQLEQARRNLEYCTIKVPEYPSPLRVLDVKRSVGEWVKLDNSETNSSLLSLYDPKKMQARVDVTQESISAVKKGADVIVRTDARPDKEYKGNVLRTEPLADLAKNTITVRVCIDEPDTMLFPEMTAKITFFDKKGEVAKTVSGDVSIPKIAIFNESTKQFVYVVENNRAEKVEVKIVKRKSNSFDVTGIRFGQRVIVSDLEKLKDGIAVEESR